MAPRPAKRQRRSKTIDSDEDDDASQASGLPLRTQQPKSRLRHDQTPTSGTTPVHAKKGLSNASNETSSGKPSPVSSPQKTRKVTRQEPDTKNNKSLHSFFNKVSEEQRWQRQADNTQQEAQHDLVADEIVDNDFSEDDIVQPSQEQPSQRAALPVSKPLANYKINGSRSSTPTSSQRFARSMGPSHLADAALVKVEQDVSDDYRPWSDRYGPSSIDELAIHKKKVADVQKWLEDMSSKKSPQRILVLKGPAGSGKSTTLSMIAQQIGISIISWRNPTVSDTGLPGSVQQFADFLDRGGQFDALSFGNGATASTADQHQHGSERRLLMVEEFPISMTRQSGNLDSFRSILLEHILRSTKPPRFDNRISSDTYHPVVLVISETLLTSSTALSDSFTAHRLLGPELSNHPLVSVVEFNPVAPTFVSKAMDLVIKKEARESLRRRIPGPVVLQQLSEIGDIRSAINRLEFLCAKGDDGSDWSGTVASLSKKTSKSGVPLTDKERSSLQLISQRESTLDMFHAAGKIVYNKRADPKTLSKDTKPLSQPPNHLMHLHKVKASQVDVDALLDETGTDIQTFISTLHENYVLSCNGDDFVESLENCSEILSASDSLNPESRSLLRARGSARTHSNHVQSGNYEMLRQDEISFQTACRGLLFSLPFPVNRAVPAGSRRQDAFKMFYPASLRLWKPAEEINDLISFYVAGLDCDDNSLAGYGRSVTGVAAWRSKNFASTDVSNYPEADFNTRCPSGSLVSRDSLVIERLPYLAIMRTAREQSVRMLEKITQFRGTRIPGDELVDEEQDEGMGPSIPKSLAQKVEEAHKLLQTPTSSFRGIPTAIGKPQGLGKLENDTSVTALEKMYISDDDIQDD